MTEVLYNLGGHVAHISIKLDIEDSFNAFAAAANIAFEHGGRVEALYHDSKFGSRSRVGGVERAGLVLEFGSFEENEAVAREFDRLRKGVEDYLLWEPRKAGHAEAHRKLVDLVVDLVRAKEDE